MSAIDCKKKLFEEIYAKNYDTVYKYVLVSLRYNGNMADDCMQDILMLLMQKIDTVVAHPNPGGFFIVTASNYIKKYKTAIANNLKKITPLDENLPGLSYEENIDHIFEQTTNVEVLKKEVLHRLDHKEMALYELFYERKLPISEISKILDISKGNVKVKLYRMRIKVKKMVRELFL